MKRCRLIPLIVLFLAVASLAARGAIIYQDNFDGSSSTNLNGLPPDVDNNGGGHTWLAYSGYKANGQIATASVNQGAWLPIVPQSGLIYTLSASFTGIGPDGSSLSWIALGFSKDIPANPETGANRFIEGVTIGRAWTLFRANNTNFPPMNTNANQVQLGNNLTGTALTEPWPASAPFEGGDVDIKIVLDTQPATWTATFYAKRPADSSYFQVSTGALPLLAQDIGGIGFARPTGSLSGFIKSFELSAVPEPTSSVLLAIGALLCSGVASRRRASRQTVVRTSAA